MADNSFTILAQGVLVRGNIFSQDVMVVEGSVEGNLFGNRVVIKGTGRVQGSLSCRALCIEAGGVLNGKVTISNDTPALTCEIDEPKSLPEPGQTLDFELFEAEPQQRELPIEESPVDAAWQTGREADYDQDFEDIPENSEDEPERMPAQDR